MLKRRRETKKKKKRKKLVAEVVFACSKVELAWQKSMVAVGIEFEQMGTVGAVEVAAASAWPRYPFEK
jgi:hypothetical protein